MDPTKKELYTAKRPSGVNLEDPSIQSTWSELRADTSETKWLWLHLSQPTVVSVKCSGAGDIHEMISAASDDEILFGAIRLMAGAQVKFFHVFFVCVNVNGMKKGKASLFESGIFQALDGAHGKFHFNGLEEFNVENLGSQFTKLTKLPLEL